MWIPRDQSKFTARFKYVEFMRFVPKDESLSRVKLNGISLFDSDEIETFRRQNSNLGLYTSVFSYDSRNIDNAAKLSSLYFDLDSSDILETQRDAIKLVEHLEDFIPRTAIRTYFSGKKGFHLELEGVTLGVGPSNDLSGLFRYIATQLRDKLSLDTLDFAVYDNRRMWRLPNSRHQESGFYKVELESGLLERPIDEIVTYATEPHATEVPDQAFSPKANEWYREYAYEKEAASQKSPQAMIERFNRRGSGVLLKNMDGELEFDPISLFENCHAIMDLWNKAERTKDLSHEERLFLCSILTYNYEAQRYLHAILQNCDDYNEAKTQSHIDDWVRRRDMGIGGKPFSCRRANESGSGCADCHLEPKERVQHIGGKWVSLGGQAEPSPLRFAYYRRRK